MKAHVWVMPKRTVLDPQGQTIQHALSGLGYSAVRDVRQGKFFVLNLDGWSREEAQKQLEHISKEVLTNTVIEEYRSEEHTSELQSHHDLVCRFLLEKKKLIFLLLY